MKVIAMYLPQFHKVKENDAWWGEGFTDWVSARNAAPLFEGHYQPHLPADHNYYDLMKKETMIHQADLMKHYDVDGLCFYHYWFEKGKKILQRPAENLLQWHDIEMPFCFSWANETWARSWSQLSNTNVWSNLLEPDHVGQTILLNQDYGSERDWEEHFNYLLPFFMDDRYIKVDGRPVFLIYKADLIGCLGDMLTMWRRLAREAGLPDLYVLGSFAEGFSKSYLDGEVIHEPVSANRTLLAGMYENHARRLSYQDVWNEILTRKGSDHTYFGGFVGYDDTPRRGVEGVVIENGTPGFFGEFLTELMAKNDANGKDIVFINAWNEWGEGMHLEPDQKYGTAFLEQIPLAKNKYRERVFFYKNQTYFKRENSEIKFELYMNDVDLWMSLREHQVPITKWFKEKGFQRIAIYGYGIMGRHLIAELKDGSVKAEYIIDASRDKIHAPLPVYLPEEELPATELVVVTPYYYYESVKHKLGDKMPLFSLGEIIHELYNGSMRV